jgi:YidC/Oxa1 family membrane protein insertase
MSFDLLFDVVGAVLSSLYDIRASYGFMIIGATLIALVLTTPLTFKSARSMRILQQHQPEVRALQDRHRNDPTRRNEELQRLYREHRINPLGGCLPLLVQFPVFAVLSPVLHGVVQRVPDAGSALGWAAGHLAAGTGAGPVPPAPPRVHPFAPAHLPAGRLADALHTASSLPWLGMNLADSGTTALMEHGLVTALPYLALVAFVAVTGILQQRQSRTPSTGAANPQQELVARFMPLVLPVMALTMPAGLVLYFAVTNLFRLGQGAIIARTVTADGPARLTPATSPARRTPARAAPGAAGRRRRHGSRPR